MPARSCLLSGQFSRTCQGFLGNYSKKLPDGTSTMPEYPEEERRFLLDPTMPEQLKAVGYETTLIGKWHVQPSPPQVRQGEVASIIDVMPTVLDLAGGHTPASVQGHSLAPALLAEGDGPDHAIIETTRGEIGLRTPGHLCGLQLDEDRRKITDAGGCLYDLEADPYQMTNLMETGDSADVAAVLGDRLRAWHEATTIRDAPDLPEAR